MSPMVWVRHDRGPFGMTVGFTMLYLGFGAILLAQLHAPPGSREPGRIARGLASIGRQSCPMYPWFLDTGIWLRAAGLGDRLERAFVSVGLDGEFGHALWWCVTQTTFVVAVFAVGRAAGGLVERPVLAWRDRRFPGDASAASP